MDAFDGKREMTIGDKLFGNITIVLLSPLHLLWNSWACKNISNIVENALFLLNSVLWGTALEFLYSRFKNNCT